MDEDTTRNDDPATGPDAPGGGRRPGEDGPASGGSRALAAGLAFLLAAAAAGLYFGLSGGDGGPDGRPTGGDGGELAVAAEVVDFPTLEGDTASLADYSGQVVVLNLWGTWCPPCRREIPDLVELQDRIEPRGGTVIGLAVDSGEPSSIRDFAEDFGVNYPIWYGQGQEVVSHYRAMGYPTTLLIDREGVIRERRLGPQTAESLMEDLEPLLAEG
jgi:thiol-disulfide isomerase/thioredoxin